MFKVTHVTMFVHDQDATLSFYKKLGFSIDKEEDIHIGNGYLMEDYVMLKML